jgi:hypothetical protein
MRITTVRQLIQALRAGKYTSMGSYPTYFIAADGEALSHEAVQANIMQVGRAIQGRNPERQWRVIAVDVNWEDEALYCADTGERIECAYPTT